MKILVTPRLRPNYMEKNLSGARARLISPQNRSYSRAAICGSPCRSYNRTRTGQSFYSNYDKRGKR